MSELRDAAKRLLEVLSRDHSLSEKHTAVDGLAVSVDGHTDEAPKAAPKPKKEKPAEEPAAEKPADEPAPAADEVSA